MCLLKNSAVFWPQLDKIVLYCQYSVHIFNAFGLAVLSYHQCKLFLYHHIHAVMFFNFTLQNIVLSGGSTMFKDFGRKMQRDVKRVVDARLKLSEELSQGRIKVRFQTELHITYYNSDGYDNFFTSKTVVHCSIFFKSLLLTLNYEQ